MEEQEKKQECSFELRSEKVRSIVGQIPSSFNRYGISIIGLVLCLLVGVTYLLPYKQVYSGNATVHAISSEPVDSIETTIFLKFENRHPSSQRMGKSSLIFQSPTESIDGVLLCLSQKRDTLGRQEAVCRTEWKQLKKIENCEVDFILTTQSGTLLSLLFSGLLEQ